jgi:hypothetical protein
MRAFGQLFLSTFQDPRVKFMAVNTDQPPSAARVMNLLFVNSWPWAQVLAADQRSTSISQYVGMRLEDPILAIVDGDGQIRYAGPASGAVPRIILGAIISFLPSIRQDEQFTPSRSSYMPRLEKQDLEISGEQRQAEGIEQTSERTSVSEEEQIDPQAENWYQMALVHKKSGRILGYKRMIDYCRMILERSPNSSVAGKARTLLREMPDRDKQKYNITDEEMGL